MRIYTTTTNVINHIFLLSTIELIILVFELLVPKCLHSIFKSLYYDTVIRFEVPIIEPLNTICIHFSFIIIVK